MGQRPQQTDVEVLNDGFGAAADLCLELLSSRIADLRTQVRSGSPLSPEQVQLLVELTDLKDETDRQLRNFERNEDGPRSPNVAAMWSAHGAVP
jgi:hypothetical protein